MCYIVFSGLSWCKYGNRGSCVIAIKWSLRSLACPIRKKKEKKSNMLAEPKTIILSVPRIRLFCSSLANPPPLPPYPHQVLFTLSRGCGCVCVCVCVCLIGHHASSLLRHPLLLSCCEGRGKNVFHLLKLKGWSLLCACPRAPMPGQYTLNESWGVGWGGSITWPLSGPLAAHSTLNMWPMDTEHGWLGLSETKL